MAEQLPNTLGLVCPYKITLLKKIPRVFETVPLQIYLSQVTQYHLTLHREDVVLTLAMDGTDWSGNHNDSTSLWRILENEESGQTEAARSFIEKALLSYLGRGFKKKLSQLNDPRSFLTWLKDNPWEVLEMMGWAPLPLPVPGPKKPDPVTEPESIKIATVDPDSALKEIIERATRVPVAAPIGNDIVEEMRYSEYTINGLNRIVTEHILPILNTTP